MTIGHYLNSLEKLTRQWTPTNFREPKRQRLYLKDIDCPDAWHQQLRETFPEMLFYLNECVGEKGGPGALHEKDRYNHLALGQGIAPAGDLMSNLPEEMRAENMMCYIGHEGTYTPAHREMCATLGQNIMVETSDTDKGEKPGSSIWFMTETKDREVVSEYFLSMLGHDIEVESHFAQMIAWKKAPFPVYIVEQKVGDFVLVPPLAPHQVWNRGTRTMKVAWNRTTVETLEMALHEALPRARMVCRDEQYKCKATVYYSLLKYSSQLRSVEKAEESSFGDHRSEPVRHAPRVRQLQRDFKRLFALYRTILISEMFSSELPKEKHVEFIPFDSNVTCSYCRCNIFNRFLTCKTCVGELENGDEDTYDICMDCYAMGRSCGCLSNLQWVEQWQWPELIKHYDQWRAMAIYIDGYVDDNSPQTLEVERECSGKKPIAQICQEQLKQRPWRDITKPLVLDPLPGDSDAEPEADDDGRAKKKKKPTKRKSQLARKQTTACHTCKHQEANWKLAFCTACSSAYCYGTLWRAFDMKPEIIMENPNWECPKCLKICSCGACRRRDPSQVPYQPKGTLLGHDTRLVADPRSVESLVDFSRTNLAWLKGETDTNPHNSVRMQKLVQKAQAEKSRDEILDEDVVADHHGPTNGLQRVGGDISTQHMAIDPALCNDEDETQNDSSQTAPIASMGPENADSRDTTSGSAQMEHGLSSRFQADAGLRTDQDHQNGDNAFVSPADLMKEPDYSAYPEPSITGRERMMGIGYYQQRNDADKILFDAPDATTPRGGHPNTAYPRLQADSENYLLVRTNKRRQRESMPSGKGSQDQAHLQFLEAQKKQKLSEARKNEKYFMIKNQLDGNKPLTIKLSLPNNKQFLERIEAFSKGEAGPRHNPRPARISFAKIDDNFEEDAAIVTSDVFSTTEDTIAISDVFNKTNDTAHITGDDDQPGGTTNVAKRRVRRPTKASATMDALSGNEVEDTIPVVKRRAGRPSKTSASKVVLPDNEMEDSITVAKRHVGRPSKASAIVDILSDDGEENDLAVPKRRSIGHGLKIPITEHRLPESDQKNSNNPKKRGPGRPSKKRARSSETAEKTYPDVAEPKKRRRTSAWLDGANVEDLNDSTIEVSATAGLSRRDSSAGNEGIEREEEAMEDMETEGGQSISPEIQVVVEVNAEKGNKSIKKSSSEPQFERDEGWIMDDFSDDRESSLGPQSAPALVTDGAYRLGDFSDDSDYNSVMVDENYNPTPPIPQSKSSSAAVSPEYHNAKLEALRIVEAEMEAEISKPREVVFKKPFVPTKTLAKTMTAPNSIAVVINQNEFEPLSVKPKPTVTAPPAAPKEPSFMSMSERRAAQGKNTTIVRPKSGPSFSPVTAPSDSAGVKQSQDEALVSQPSTVLPRPTGTQRRTYSTASSSDDDEDEEIPARRPVGVKPKVGGRPMGLIHSSNSLGITRK